ncbi:MAG: DUF1501 domain-containing protein [Pirellulales bacterium]
MTVEEPLGRIESRRCETTRREFFWRGGGGFAGLAMLDLLARTGRLRGADGEAHGTAHFPARAKHVVFLFMNGGPSQVDTFDPKPALEKYHGQTYSGPLAVGSNGRPVGHLTKSAFSFRPHGSSGLEISSLYPHLSRFADDLCVIRSMHTDTAAHASGCIQMNTGAVLIGKPCLGSWLSYGLGSENENLPSFVVMTDPRGGPIGSGSNWSCGFMPAQYQGTMFRSSSPPLLDLATPAGVSPASQRHGLDLLHQLNSLHADRYQQDGELLARVESYELAYRMQTAATEAVDFSQETAATLEMYGVAGEPTADFGRKCLITRRLIERGVRFIQLYSGGGHIEDTWDGHNDCVTNHRLHAAETDQPIAALIADLKRTGLWDETLLIWGGEFGRTPTSEGVDKPGRDHDWHGFSMWLAGAGVRGGQPIGSTDELGFAAVEDPCHVRDLHATILHLMGLDHRQLTFTYQGLAQRLTGVDHEAKVVERACL